jgi:transcriptional regulator with XRE-family HTH domain
MHLGAPVWVQQRDYKKVGRVLKIAREEAGLTQAVLASRLSKPQSFVSSCESGQRRVDLLELQRIATAIGTDPVDLYSAILEVDAKPKSSKR